MKTLHATKLATFCKCLFKLEQQGRYDEALVILEDIWQDKTGLPDVADLEPKLAAELILRCGSIIGFYGHIKQIPKTQEKSKNLLSEARNRFLEMCEIEKVAECENYIALAYWRAGELNEAEVWIEEALSRNLPNSSVIRIHSHIVNSIILIAKEKYEEIISVLEPHKSEFQKCGNSLLLGSFWMNLGLAYQELQKPLLALERYELARHYYQKSKNPIYLGTIENNLAQTYKLIKNFPKAYEFIDNAAKIFKQIKDRTREGFAFDTKAQIFLAENKFSEALEAAENAVRILKLSENAAYLVECFQTKIKILLYLDRFTDAAFCLVEAVQIAKSQISEESATNLISEFEKVLQIKEARKINQAVNETAARYSAQNLSAEKTDLQETVKSNGSPKNDEDLELSLPKELAQYNSEDLRGVWISSTDLEGFGLTPDSFALIAQGEVKRGELAAIEEASLNKVICGLYDAEFGLISLESANGDLQLFDADKFEILGKIVGVGKKKTADGKLVIESITSI